MVSNPRKASLSLGKTADHLTTTWTNAKLGSIPRFFEFRWSPELRPKSGNKFDSGYSRSFPILAPIYFGPVWPIIIISTRMVLLAPISSSRYKTKLYYQYFFFAGNCCKKSSGMWTGSGLHICQKLIEKSLGPWWGSSGQHGQLSSQRSEFDTCSVIKFNMKDRPLLNNKISCTRQWLWLKC